MSFDRIEEVLRIATTLVHDEDTFLRVPDDLLNRAGDGTEGSFIVSARLEDQLEPRLVCVKELGQGAVASEREIFVFQDAPGKEE